MQKVVESSGICKRFGETEALRDISFSVNESEIFGFIGPDGAGKTTLFRIITTLLLPDEGEMTVMGLDCRTGFMELRKNIGYMPGRFSLYQDLSVEENLNFYATVFGTTIVCIPESIFACVLAAASSIRIFGIPDSMALAIPPRPSISLICSQALWAIS